MNPIFRFSVLGVLIAGVFATYAGAAPPASPKIDDLCGGDTRLGVMSSDLLEARRDLIAGVPAMTAARNRMPQAVRAGKIQVIIGVKEITEPLLATIKSAGLEVVHTYSKGALKTVTVRCSDPRQLDAVAFRSETLAITSEPAGTTLTGSVTSQGDAAHRAANARANLGINGTGYRVGVLSDSIFTGRGGVAPGSYPGNHTGSLDQASLDLPAQVWVVDPGVGGTDEGNAMAQLIYDLAPGCDIAFASTTGGYYPFASNITLLATDTTAPADILVDDYIYYAEPMYQNGPIAIAANGAVAMGIPYFSSAGNFAADAHERSYVDANAPADDMSFPLPTGIDFHDFGVASGMAADRHFTVTLPSGGQIVAELHWDEPYGGVLGAGPGSAADLDLYLVNSLVLPLNPGNIVKSSTNPQGTIASPAGDAVEEIVETVAPGVYHLCIEHYAGRDDTAPIPLTIHLLVRVNGLGAVITDAAYLGDRTVYGHAAAENVQAIAAMDCREEPLGNFTAPPVQLDVESFSSLGGALPFWFPDTGTPRNVAAQTRNKPELTGIDGTDNTFFGTDVEPNGWPNFFGTSAAAPHVAAIAALMLDQADNNAQSPTPAAIYSIMQSTARDAEAVGWDSLSGFGLVDANAAAGDPGLVPVEFSVFLIE